jgi:HEAT repeat protein
MLALIAEYMEKGFLENIIDMFRHDRGLYEKLPGLMADERSRVRLGTVALVESLMEAHRDEIASSIPAIAGLLGHRNPLVRADAAYLLGVIGRGDAIPYLEAARGDEVRQVRDIVEETINELRALRP